MVKGEGDVLQCFLRLQEVHGPSKISFFSVIFTDFHSTSASLAGHVAGRGGILIMTYPAIFIYLDLSFKKIHSRPALVSSGTRPRFRRQSKMIQYLHMQDSVQW